MVEARARVQARRRSALVQLRVARANRNVSVTGGADARVNVHARHARGAVQARRRRTLVQVRLTDRASETIPASTAVLVGRHAGLSNLGVDGVAARGSVHARHRQALVDVRLAVETGVTGHADARVTEHRVDARAAAVARVRRALVQIELTLLSLPTARTRAHEIMWRYQDSVVIGFCTSGPIHARHRGALVGVRLTDNTNVAVRANAVEITLRDRNHLLRTGAIVRVDTVSTVLAWRRATLLDVNVALFALPAVHARTVVRVFGRDVLAPNNRHVLNACGAVHTRIGCALVDVSLAVVPLEPR